MPVTFVASAYPYLKLTDLQTAFDDAVSLSYAGPQTMASTLNLTSVNASISVSTQQFICTGDALFSSTSAIAMPAGNTLQRPNLPQFGHLRANSDAGTIEVYLQSGKWATVQTTAAATTPVNPPVSMNGPAFGQATTNAIPLGWTAPSGGTAPFTYSVQYRLAGTANWTTWVQETTATSTTVSGLLPAARYEFQVTAFNAAGQAVSPVTATNTLGYLPGGPGNLTASTPTSTSVTLNWLAVNSSTPIAYVVQYANQGAATWSTFGDPTMDTNMTVTGLTANSTFNFQVVAKTTGSTSDSLVTQRATTSAATVAPNAPSNIMFAGVGTNTATVSWTPPSSGTQPLVYQLQFQVTGASDWTNYKSATTATSVTMANMTSGSAYNIRVVATNSAGNSTSAPASVTTLIAAAANGAVAGTQNSGTTNPVITGPQSANAVNGAALPMSGVTVLDPPACYSAGTMALTVTCGSGTITMTDQNGNQINGSGTPKITLNTTYSGVLAALASLVYTASKVGADAISIVVSDQLIKTSSVSINVSVVAASGTGNPTPPPGGVPATTVTQTGQPTDGTGTQARRIRDCLDGFGINVRLEDVGYNANYTLAQAATIENYIAYLGGGHIKWLREVSGINMNPSWLAQVAQNVNAKYIFPIDYIVNPSSYQTVLNLIDTFAVNFANYISGFEGVYGADDTNNLAAAAQFQATIYNLAHSLGLPAFQLTPFFQSSYNQFGKPAADIATCVLYPWTDPNGANDGSTTDPNGYFFDVIQNASFATPSVPVAVSAFSWDSYPDGTVPPSTAGVVNETTQAAYMLETVFSAFKLGAKYYFYDGLIDIAQGLSVEDIGSTNCLFDVDGNPKVSAVAVHNMFNLLYDSSTSANTFFPGLLNYTITGKPAPYSIYTNTGYQDVVLQKSNGDFWIVMWNEQPLNTVTSNIPLTVPSTNITLTFANPKTQVNIYDPLQNTSAPVSVTNAVSSMTVSLPTHPIFIQVID